MKAIDELVAVGGTVEVDFTPPKSIVDDEIYRGLVAAAQGASVTEGAAFTEYKHAQTQRMIWTIAHTEYKRYFEDPSKYWRRLGEELYALRQEIEQLEAQIDR